MEAHRNQGFVVECIGLAGAPKALAAAIGTDVGNIYKAKSRGISDTGWLIKALKQFKESRAVDKKPLQENDYRVKEDYPDADKGKRWIPPPGEGVSLEMAEYLELRVCQLRMLFFKTKGKGGDWGSIVATLDEHVPLSEDEKKRIAAQERAWKMKRRKGA